MFICIQKAKAGYFIARTFIYKKCVCADYPEIIIWIDMINYLMLLMNQTFR